MKRQKKEFEVFLYAFYMKNGIFPPDELLPEKEEKAMTREELEEVLRAEQMAATMEKYTPYKAIEAGSGKGA